MISYAWSFDKDIQPLTENSSNVSYKVNIRCRPLWQLRIIRVLRWFGLNIPESTIEVEIHVR